MAFTNDIHHADGGLYERVSNGIKTWRAEREVRAQKDRVYRQTLKELNSLSRRDLDDIGIHPSSIKAIAHEAAYGK